MLLRRFALHVPEALPDVFSLIARHGEDASAYAGGTELLVALKSRVLHYGHLIDLKRIPQLADITREGNSIAVGALATHHRIANNPLVCERFSAYAELSNHVANIRVRCAGTLGGNLCFAEPHADPPALLAALRARIRLEGPQGVRELAVADFILGAFETARRPDEIATAIVLPPMPAHARASYRKFGHLERPAVGAAALVVTDADGQRCMEARLWLGAIGTRPLRLEKAEAACTGAPTGEVIDQLSRVAPAEIKAIEAFDDVHGSADYKRHLALVLMKRALTAVLPPSPDVRVAA